MSIRSVHSRRAVPTQRSAIAFARGCLRRRPDHPGTDGGEHRVERGGELAVPIAQQEPQPVEPQARLLALDSPVPPADVLPGQAHDQRPDGGSSGRKCRARYHLVPKQA